MTYIHKWKCLSCQLHFAVYSYDASWLPEHGCPECGNREFFIHWRAKTTQQIYEFVPGKSEMVSMTTPDTSGAGLEKS